MKSLLSLAIILFSVSFANATERANIGFLSCSTFGFGFTGGISGSPGDFAVQVANFTGVKTVPVTVTRLETTPSSGTPAYLLLANQNKTGRDVLLVFNEEIVSDFNKHDGLFFLVKSGFDPKTDGFPSAFQAIGHASCMIQW